MAPESIEIPGDPPLHLRRWSRKGEPVLLLHGLGGNTYWWETCAPLLSGLQCVALDFRGHGDSGWDKSGAYGIPAFVADIERARIALGWDKFHLVAHSMGGRTSIGYASRYNERLKKLVAIDFLPEFSHHMARKYNLAFRVAPPVYPTREEIVPRFRLEPPETVLDRAALDRFAVHCIRQVPGGYAWKFDWKLFHVRYESAMPEFPLVKIPTLIVYGEKSSVMNEQQARDVSAQIRGAETAGIAGVYHHVPLDAPAELARLIRDFLA